MPTHVILRGGILRAPSKAHPGPESSFPVTAPAEAHPDVQSSLRHGVLWTRINAWQTFKSIIGFLYKEVFGVIQSIDILNRNQ